MENKKAEDNKKCDWKFYLAVSFLPGFMLLIFGPAEIFFANSSEFSFLYGEFAVGMVVIFIAAVLLMTLVLCLLKGILLKAASSVLFAFSLTGWLQVMWLNRNLDLLGVNPEGYKLQGNGWIMNLLLWLAVAAVILSMAFWKETVWKKLVLYGSGFLIVIQLAAFLSLLLTAPAEAYKRPTGDDRLSGTEQYTVSAEKNVIVFVLDYFSSQYLQQMLEVYPDGADCLHDFTYYNNADCTYYGTFPSMAHMLTGCEVEPDKPINDWCREIWQNEKTVDFYQELQDSGYKANVFTTDANVLTAANGAGILRGRLSNVTNEPNEVETDKKLLTKTMLKMSCYRMVPEIAKPYFYTNVSEYSEAVRNMGDGILQTNSDFYARLLEKGLEKKTDGNYFILQHLIGTHEFNTAADGTAKDKATVEETARGCMTILEEYLKQLKELGVYDDAMIIVTADHGGCEKHDLQIIYYVKQPGEAHEVSPVTNAPVSHCDLLPTIAQTAGLEYTKYGNSIFDFSQDELRERSFWLRKEDEAYPESHHYAGGKKGNENVYYKYTYEGDLLSLITQIDEGPTEIEEMYDTFF